jgi:hypothetical protein
MTDEELLLRKLLLLEGFAAAKLKLQTLQDAAHKEARHLEQIAECLKHGGECDKIKGISALVDYLSAELPELLRNLEDACCEKATLQRMLAHLGIAVED